MEQQIEVTPHTFVRVEVINQKVRWSGRDLPKGETFIAQHYQIAPAIKVGQVKLVAVLPDYDPQAPAEPEELAIASEAPADET